MFGSLTGLVNKIKENKIMQSITENIVENYGRLKN